MNFFWEISNDLPNDLLGAKCIQDSWIIRVIIIDNIEMD